MSESFSDWALKGSADKTRVFLLSSLKPNQWCDFFFFLNYFLKFNLFVI